jgi:competence protein ComEC
VLHKEVPFLRIGLPLCAGIISGLYFKPAAEFFLAAALIVISCFSASLFFNRSFINVIFGISFTFSLYVCGLLLYLDEKEDMSILEPDTSVFAGTLTDYPLEKENSYMLTIKINYRVTSQKKEQTGGTLLLYEKKDPSIQRYLPGDNLVIKCTPQEIKNRGNPNEFDYKFFMETHGIRYSAYIRSQDVISHVIPRNRKLRYRALIIREKLISMYRERGITGERLALVAAIILGQKNMLEPEQKQNFMKAGVMHIMAVSGLHAGILSLFIFNVLFFMKRRLRILRVVLTIIILWSFAFVTGLTPSVMRATLMFSFLHSGNLMKRRVNSINSVLASAFILILLKPSVIFETGFLLSYSAVLFIITFYQSVYSKIEIKNWFSDKIWQSVVVTIVAQAGTLALTVMLFNRFPTYFIISNIIIVPLSSLLIIAGSLVPLTYPVEFLSQFLANLLNHLTGLTEFLTSKAASLPLSTIENIGMTTFQCLMLTLIVFSLGYFLSKKYSLSIFVPIALISLSVVYGTVHEILIRKTNQLIVYNTPGSTTIGIKTGKLLNVYTDTSFISPAVSRHGSTLGLKIRMNILNEDFNYLKAGQHKILVCNSLNQYAGYGIKPEIVILTGKGYSEKYISDELLPEKLIITSDLRFTKKADFTTIDTVHSVKKSGAFITAL